jgi:hypothetical protein
MMAQAFMSEAESGVNFWRQGLGSIKQWDLQAQAFREAERILAETEAGWRGDTFDFIDDANPSLNSFYRRCTKTGQRSYEWDSHIAGQGRLAEHVGSIRAEVFHVERAQ